MKLVPETINLLKGAKRVVELCKNKREALRAFDLLIETYERLAQKKDGTDHE